jgi:hypothetical protein
VLLKLRGRRKNRRESKLRGKRRRRKLVLSRKGKLKKRGSRWKRRTKLWP